MTGTGTQTDPYIVDNWADFASKAAESGSFIKFADGGGTIDMNKEAPNGIENTIINGAYVDGNGWTIESLYNKSNAFAYGGSVSNLRFLNVFSESIFFDNTYLSNCVITGVFGNSFFVSYNGQYVERCSFNIFCYGSESILTAANHWMGDRTNTFNHCPIKITNNSPYQKIFQTTEFNSGLITGNTDQTDSCFSSVSAYNSVFDVEAPNMEMTLGNSSGICIANTEKAPNVSVSGNWQGVTTAQMSDAEALASIGFPIGVE